MKRYAIVCALLVVAAVLPSSPSITLTNGYVVQQPAGTTIETDNSMAAANMSILWRADGTAVVNTIFPAGTVSGSTFTQSGRIGSRSTTFDTLSGNWTSSDGTSGTVSGAALTGAKTTVEKTWRNQNESFHTANGIIAGSQSAW